MKYVRYILLLSIALFCVTCKKDEEVQLTSLTIKDVEIVPSFTSANISLNVSTNATMSDIYLEYSTEDSFKDYQKEKMKLTEKAGAKYQITLSDLSDSTKYYIRCRATNKYSSLLANYSGYFTTSGISMPIIGKVLVSDVAYTTATCKVNAIEDGGATVTKRGICYSISPNPTTSDKKVIYTGSGIGSFTCNLTGLEDGATYYVRAYATNMKGTSYSEEQSFTTKEFKSPTITTDAVSNLSYSSVTCGGNITDDGGKTITECGICFSTSSNPTSSDNKVIYNGSGIGSFTCNLTGLEDGATYYVRAYATNSKGTSYGEEVNFTTTAYSTPTVTTSTVTNKSYTSATCGGNVTSNGGLTITERGICYSTISNPTISDKMVTSGSGTGSFTCDLTGLEDGMTYYVRAYAKNSKGTSYGEEVNFTTTAYSTPTVTTSTVTNKSYTSATCGGNVTSNGGLTITERGVCYSTTSNPTIYDTKVTASSAATGSFSCSLTGLSAGMTYYVRAYATNSKGTSYGEEVNFTTTAYSTPTVTTSTVTNKSYTSATCGGNVTSNGGLTITERGICYSTTSNPTIYDTKVTASSAATGSFSCSLTGLSAGMTYYVRAYATNSKGTSYGEEKTFHTTAYSTPTVTTSTVTNRSYTSATCGGNVTSDGGSSIIERGICYSTTSNPTIYDTKVTASSAATGSFSCSLTGLSEGTKYYVCAYATNSKGTSYGSDVTFTTMSHQGELPVNVSNLTGTWKYANSYGVVYYWVLKSGGTAYYIQDHSSYTSNGSYEKFVGTWVVNGSTFIFNQTKFYSYSGGSLDDSGSNVDTDIVNIISLNSSIFTDGSGNTWMKSTLPSYIK